MFNSQPLSGLKGRSTEDENYLSCISQANQQGGHLLIVDTRYTTRYEILDLTSLTLILFCQILSKRRLIKLLTPYFVTPAP